MILVGGYLDTFTAYEIVIWVCAVATALSIAWLIVNAVISKRAKSINDESKMYTEILQSNALNKEKATDNESDEIAQATIGDDNKQNDKSNDNQTIN